MTRTLPGAESAHAAIERIAEAGLPSQEPLEEVARRIERVVPSDGYFIGATDPHTSLVMGAGVVRDLPHDQCAPTWDYEFPRARLHEVPRHRSEWPVSRRPA